MILFYVLLLDVTKYWYPRSKKLATECMCNLNKCFLSTPKAELILLSNKHSVPSNTHIQIENVQVIRILLKQKTKLVTRRGRKLLMFTFNFRCSIIQLMEANNQQLRTNKSMVMINNVNGSDEAIKFQL